jgi:FkbM family methyltransferase
MFYSQCQEDKTLWEKFFSKYTLPDEQKYFFEMGAINGVMYSNTKFYEDILGWKGILVEPNPVMFLQLIQNRPKAYHLNAVVSDQTSPIDFSVCMNVPAVCSVKSTQPADFNAKYYNNSQMISLNLIPITLTEILRNSGLKRIDLMVIDVEGHEVNVLKSFDFSVPTVLWMIEFLDDEEKNEEVKTIMTSNGFEFIEKVAHNGVFIHKDYKSYFAL